MLQTFKLILPAIFPSWRFFDIIAPSPRIEFRVLKTEKDTPDNWQEFRLKPEEVPFMVMIKRMIWNPHWNESLFLVSCAERFMEHPTEHSRQEILNRITHELKRSAVLTAEIPYLQFRLLFISREKDVLKREIAYVSPVYLALKDMS